MLSWSVWTPVEPVIRSQGKVCMLLYVRHVAGDCAEHIVPSIHIQLSEVIDTNEHYYYY